MKKSALAMIYRRVPILRELLNINDTLCSIRRSVEAIQMQQQSQHGFEVMRLLDFTLQEHPRYGDPKRLFRAAFQGCSQNGEDGMIGEIFRRIGVTDQRFVEIGVGDGNENNTAFLISKSWRGYWIDGNPEILKTIKDRGWAASEQVRGLVALISKENASELVQNLGIPREFDLLSIDVDQNTFHIWNSLANLRPRVVVVEYNAAFPPDVEWVVPYNANAVWDGTQNFGASLKVFQLMAADLGYSLVGCDFTGVNAFFVRSELCGTLFASPFTAENHFEPPRYCAQMRRSHPSRAFDGREETKPSFGIA